MNEKEISEIRRRFRADKSNITHVRGCYVNEKQEIVSQFDQPLSLLPQEECENMLSVLRRTLSGTLGKNLIEMPFTTAQVIDSDEHRLLMALRDSKLTDEELAWMMAEEKKSTRKGQDRGIYQAFRRKLEEIEDIVKNNEPHLALYSGEDGMDSYRQIFSKIKNVINDKYLIALEIGCTQKDAVTAIIKKTLPDAVVTCTKDLSGRDRMIFVTNK